MLRDYAILPVTEEPQKEEVILLQEKDVKILLRAIAEIFYNKQTDIYDIPDDLQTMADDLGINILE